MIITMTVEIMTSLRLGQDDFPGFFAHLLDKFYRTRFGHGRIFPWLMAGAEGLEPSACGFGDRRSTN